MAVGVVGVVGGVLPRGSHESVLLLLLWRGNKWIMARVDLSPPGQCRREFLVKLLLGLGRILVLGWRGNVERWLLVHYLSLLKLRGNGRRGKGRRVLLVPLLLILWMLLDLDLVLLRLLLLNLDLMLLRLLLLNLDLDLLRLLLLNLDLLRLLLLDLLRLLLLDLLRLLHICHFDFLFLSASPSSP